MARKRTQTQSSGSTILVIDDQEEMLSSTRSVLERDGHQVLTARGGADALALFQPGRIHLVLVDYFMPGMDGETVVRRLRTRDPEVQILLQTGYAGEIPPRQMMRSLDIQGYHDKSDGPDRLRL